MPSTTNSCDDKRQRRDVQQNGDVDEDEGELDLSGIDDNEIGIALCSC